MSQVLEQAGQGECMVAACSAATKCRCSMSSRCRTSSLGNLRLCDNRLSGFCTLPALESARSQRKVPQVQRTGSSTGGTPFRCLRSPVCRFRVNLVRCLPVCASLASNLSSPPSPFLVCILLCGVHRATMAIRSQCRCGMSTAPSQPGLGRPIAPRACRLCLRQASDLLHICLLSITLAINGQ